MVYTEYFVEKKIRGSSNPSYKKLKRPQYSTNVHGIPNVKKYADRFLIILEKRGVTGMKAARVLLINYKGPIYTAKPGLYKFNTFLEHWG